ncbi:MAG: cytochrome c biogenesis protein CcsA [Clostridia bacterium]|nr:cytochrome c biogenesis protein CcsA [Clostridia bacterium]
MFRYQVILLWMTVAFYGGAFLAWNIYWQNKGKKWSKTANWLGVLGFILHTAALLIRWYEVGRGPFQNIYEVLVSDTWAAILFYGLLSLKLPELRKGGFVLYPIALITIGYAVLQTPQQEDLPATYATFWLWVHVIFAKLAYGSTFLSAVAAAIYLRQQDNKRLEYWHYNLAGIGFFNLGVMIASGAVWAYNAWGRFWAWDPIETWSLISWLVYAIHLHLRRIKGWRGRKSAWLSIITFLIVVFSYFFLTLLYPSVHENLTL